MDLKVIFPNKNAHAIIVNKTQENELVKFMRYYVITMDDKNVSVFTMRGTDGLIDLFINTEYWMTEAFTSIASFFWGLSTISTYRRSSGIMNFLSRLPQITSPELSVTGKYMAEVEEIIRDHHLNNTVLSGHSQGGGVIQAIAIKLGLPVVSFSAPGTRSFGYTSPQLHSFIQDDMISITPDNDIFASVDEKYGIEYHIPCNEHFLKCHKNARTICTLAKMCGDIAQPSVKEFCVDYLDESNI